MKKTATPRQTQGRLDWQRIEQETRQAVDMIETVMGPDPYPLDTTRFVSVMWAMGYATSPQWIRHIIDERLAPAPVGDDLTSMEYYRADVIAFALAHEKLRRWLPTDPRHDWKLSSEERRALPQRRAQLSQTMALHQDCLIQQSPMVLADEDDPEVRRAAVIVLCRRIDKLCEQYQDDRRRLIRVLGEVLAYREKYGHLSDDELAPYLEDESQ